MTKGKKIALRIGCGIPLLVALSGLVFWGRTFGGVGSELDKQIAQARSLGMPVFPEDLCEPAVPEPKNAAPYYHKIAERFGDDLKPVASRFDHNYDSIWDPRDFGSAVDALADLESVFPLIEQLEFHPSCQFQRDWSRGDGLSFPEIRAMRRCVRMLCLKAEIRSRRGDWRGAIQQLDTAERIATDSGSDPVLMAAMAQIGGQQCVRQEFGLILDRFASNKEALDAVQRWILDHTSLPNFKRAFGGDVVMIDVDLQLPPEPPVLGSRDDNILAPVQAIPGGIAFLRARHLRYWCEAWEQIPADAHHARDFKHIFDRGQADIEHDNPLLSFYDGILCPSFVSTSNVLLGTQARDNLLLSSIQLLRLRNKTHQLPSTLPGDLGKVSIDPFINKPLHYRKEGHGFALYSVGADLKDDGGHLHKKTASLPRGGMSGGNLGGNDEVIEFH